MVRAAFPPAPEEADRVREVVDRVTDAQNNVSGVVTLAEGASPDRVMVDHTRAGLALAAGAA